MTLNLDSPFTISWDRLELGGQHWPRSANGAGKFEIRGAKRAYKWDIKDGMGLEGWLSWYRGWTGPAFTIVFYLWTDQHFDEWAQFSQVFLYDAHKRPAQTSSAFTDAKKRARDAQDTLNNILATASLNPPKTPAALEAFKIQKQLAEEAVVQASGQAAAAAAVGNIPSPGVRALQINHPQLAAVNISQVICEDIGTPEKQSDDLMFTVVVTLREFRQPPIVNATTSPDAAADSPEGDPESPDIVSRQKHIAQLKQTVNNAGAVHL